MYAFFARALGHGRDVGLPTLVLCVIVLALPRSAFGGRGDAPVAATGGRAIDISNVRLRSVTNDAGVERLQVLMDISARTGRELIRVSEVTISDTTGMTWKSGRPLCQYEGGVGHVSFFLAATAPLFPIRRPWEVRVSYFALPRRQDDAIRIVVPRGRAVSALHYREESKAGGATIDVDVEEDEDSRSRVLTIRGDRRGGLVPVLSDVVNRSNGKSIIGTEAGALLGASAVTAVPNGGDLELVLILARELSTELEVGAIRAPGLKS